MEWPFGDPGGVFFADRGVADAASQCRADAAGVSPLRRDTEKGPKALVGRLSRTQGPLDPFVIGRLSA